MKTCFKCKTSKPTSEFYRHSMMSDGFLGKCKACTKIDVAERYRDPAARERIRAYERARSKTKERRENLKIYVRQQKKKDPAKYKARNIVAWALRKGILVRLPCEECGNKKSEAHHIDYAKPLVVRWLCFVHHRNAHGQLAGSTV